MENKEKNTAWHPSWSHRERLMRSLHEEEGLFDDVPPIQPKKWNVKYIKIIKWAIKQIFKTKTLNTYSYTLAKFSMFIKNILENINENINDDNQNSSGNKGS